MNRKLLQQIITRYRVGGLCESVVWKVKDKTLEVPFISQDRNVTGVLSCSNVDIADGEYPIFESQELSRLLNVLGETVTIEFLHTEKDSIPIAFLFKDDNSEVVFPFADMRSIPEHKTPRPEAIVDPIITGKLTSAFVDRFSSAQSTLDSPNVTFQVKGKKLDVVLGQASGRNTKKVVLNDSELNHSGKFDAISFSAPTLKEIFSANKGSSSANLIVYAKGILHLQFDDAIKTEYYMPPTKR